MRAFLAVAAILALASVGNAESIKWTGIQGNGQWDTQNNWYPAQVPGPEDDVTIPSGDVTITSPVTVQSIGMGTQFSHSANLTIDASVTVGTLTVDGNGNLILASGAAMVSGTVQIGGFLDFQVGTASGTWTVSSHGSASLSGAGQKAFSGCGFTASGPVSATGLITLNQSSNFKVSSTLTANGDFSVRAGDTSSVLFDTSSGTLTYNGGGTFAIQAPVNIGTFNFMGGNVSAYDSVTFSNSFDLGSSSVLKTLGSAEVALPAGLTGSGYVHAEGTSLSLGDANFTGMVNLQAGMLTFSSASSFGSLTVDGGNVFVMHSLNVGMLTLNSGSINGASSLTAAGASIVSPGFDINGTLVFSGNATITGSVLSFGKPAGMIHVASGASLNLMSTNQFNGPSGSGGVVNNGVINAQGSFDLQNIDLTGTGSVSVADEFKVNTISMSQGMIGLSSGAKFKGTTVDITKIGKVSGCSSVKATIGSYSFTCPSECDDISTTGISSSSFEFKC